MFLWLAGILVLIWILGFVLFHIAAFGIHILIILAVVAIIFHFLRGSR